MTYTINDDHELYNRNESELYNRDKDHTIDKDRELYKRQGS